MQHKGEHVNILITGATGLIGSALVVKLHNAGHHLTLVSRAPEKHRQRFPADIAWLSSLASLAQLDDFTAVINLAGEPIADKRWSKAQKQRLCQSRWQITEQLVALIRASQTPPEVLISGSAVGYYGDQGDRWVTEQTAPQDGFTHRLCQEWETIARQAEIGTTRVCLLRTGVVLAPHGGILGKMRLPFRLGLGGPLGNGRQYLPWIHIDDMLAAIVWLLDRPISGPFNLVAPQPVSQRLFATQLAACLHRPARLRTPALMIRGLMGESAALVLEGQRALPDKLTNSGFVFRWPALPEALADVIHA